MLRKTLYSLSILMLMGTVLTQRADAGLILRVSAYSTTNTLLGSKTITDGSLDDSNPLTGAITNILVGFHNWTFTVTTGVGNPVIPSSSTYAELHLDAIATSSAAGKLKIEFGDDNVPAFPQNGILTGNFGGVTAGIVTADGYKHNNSDVFNASSPLAEVHIGPFTGQAFSGSDSDIHSALGVHKMLQVVTITHSGVGTSSINYGLVNTVPVPAGVVTFAIGGALMGAGEWLRRRRRVVVA